MTPSEVSSRWSNNTQPILQLTDSIDVHIPLALAELQRSSTLGYGDPFIKIVHTRTL